MDRVYSHTMGYKSPTKGNEVLTPAATSVTLEKLLLSQSSQTQRGHIIRLHLYETSRVGKSIETEVH